MSKYTAEFDSDAIQLYTLWSCYYWSAKITLFKTERLIAFLKRGLLNIALQPKWRDVIEKSLQVYCKNGSEKKIISNKRDSKIPKGQTEIVKSEDKQDHGQQNETKDIHRTHNTTLINHVRNGLTNPWIKQWKQKIFILNIMKRNTPDLNEQLKNCHKTYVFVPVNKATINIVHVEDIY